MRLLDLRDWDLERPQSWSLRLLSIDSPKDKDYAILSHTWESNGEMSCEVTYQDVMTLQQDDLTSRKSGYTKVLQTCLQTKRDGFDFAWIDTCCINKDSSSELSEAINPMWQWYYNASVCYVYFYDFQGPLQMNIQGQDQISKCDALGECFAHCRWFTRGWTLQELLAPKRIKFFAPSADGYWHFLVEKSEVEHLLSEITGIDLIALQSRDSLPGFIAARKLSWAAYRETRHVEDRAYSLFGLFGVNMPLLYGEGAKAFIRLQEELIKMSVDHSVLAWQPDPTEPHPRDLLFATSPDRYYPLGRRMVPWGDDAAHDSFHLTNRGLTFLSLSVAESDEYILLNCCLEDDFTGVVALPIEVYRPYEDRHGRRSFLRKMGSLRIESLGPTLQDVTLLRFRPSQDNARPLRQFFSPGGPSKFSGQWAFPRGFF